MLFHTTLVFNNIIWTKTEAEQTLMNGNRTKRNENTGKPMQVKVAHGNKNTFKSGKIYDFIQVFGC